MNYMYVCAASHVLSKAYELCCYSQENVPFAKEVKHARFYYLDKFLLLTSGGNLFLYKYHLDLEKQDIKR